MGDPRTATVHRNGKPPKTDKAREILDWLRRQGMSLMLGKDDRLALGPMSLVRERLDTEAQERLRSAIRANADGLRDILRHQSVDCTRAAVDGMLREAEDKAHSGPDARWASVGQPTPPAPGQVENLIPALYLIATHLGRAWGAPSNLHSSEEIEECGAASPLDMLNQIRQAIAENGGETEKLRESLASWLEGLIESIGELEGQLHTDAQRSAAGIGSTIAEAGEGIEAAITGSMTEFGDRLAHVIDLEIGNSTRRIDNTLNDGFEKLAGVMQAGFAQIAEAIREQKTPTP